MITRDPLDGVDGTTTVANPYAYGYNDPLNKTDPTGLRPGDGSITDGQAGAACDSVGGRLVLWGDTGSKVCMEPPVGRNDGGSCWPPVTPGGDALVYDQGGCGVWNTTIECARGDWIPGANFICQNSDIIIKGLTVIAVVALGVATGGAAVVAIGGSTGIAIPTGGALALVGGGTVAGGAIVLSPAAAGALVGSYAGMETLILMAKNNSGGSSGADTRTVSDVLRGKKGSVRNAPLPKGSPSWDEIANMTMDEVRAGAQANRPGLKTILKLLTDSRFNK